MTLHRFVIFLLFILSTPLVFAQKAPQIQLKTEQAFRYIGTDSIAKYYKKWLYNEQGIIVDQQEFHYNNQPHPQVKIGTLAMEDYIHYDETTKEYIFKRTQYNGPEPKTETFKALYAQYENDASKRKPIWTKTLDHYREIIKEDTCVYDAKGNVLRCDYYNYQGSTSLFTDLYSYNRQGKVKRWRTYYKWTTVTITGKTPTKKTLRRDYRYRYNGKGQNTRIYGNYYKTKLDERRSYSPSGDLLSVETTQTKRSKNSKKKREETKKRFTISEEKRVQAYQDGRLVADASYRDGKEEKGQKWEYRDSLLVYYEQRERGKVAENRQYTYNEQGIATGKTVERYDANTGATRFTVRVDFDERGNAIRETQVSGTQVLSVLEMRYNEHNHLLFTRVLLNGATQYECVFYTYQYY